MKINILTPTILVSATAFILMACTANALPNINNASYQSYDNSGEKGYLVSFELSHDSIQPSAVVINRIQQDISIPNMESRKYNVNVIAQSRKILGFKAKTTDKENGIFFKTDTANVFKAVNFKRISR